jgi:hypothetical protein
MAKQLSTWPEIDRVTEEIEELEAAILSVPALFVFGNYDYKRCIFCKGVRGHSDDCIRDRLEKEDN